MYIINIKYKFMYVIKKIKNKDCNCSGNDFSADENENTL